jgi:DNA-binding NarL/FixJ family response regulator
MRVVLELRPDVVLMDLRLPGGSGIEAIRQLVRLAPSSRILVLTRTEQNRVVEAIVAGASGYILKTAAPATIIAAVEATAAGETVISSAGAIRAVLTTRELEVFERLASGRSNQAIAAELSLSVNTVANHIASILAKLQLDNRIQAAVQAVRSGIS